MPCQPGRHHRRVAVRADPALVVGGTALSQVWLFIVAPLVGGALAAGLHRVLYPEPPIEPLASGELSPDPGS